MRSAARATAFLHVVTLVRASFPSSLDLLASVVLP